MKEKDNDSFMITRFPLQTNQVKIKKGIVPKLGLEIGSQVHDFFFLEAPQRMDGIY